MDSLEILKSEIIKDKPHVLNYAKNELIFKEGDAIDGVYFILSGRVKILKTGSRKELVLWIAEKEDYIGIISFFNKNTNYSFSAIATNNSKIVFVPTNKFEAFLSNYPAINKEMIKILCNRINFIESRLNSLRTKKTRERVILIVQLLIQRYLKDHINLKKKAKSFIYSLQDLSEILGTSQQYLKSIIVEIQNSDLLFLDNKNVVIPNYNKLLDYKP